MAANLSPDAGCDIATEAAESTKQPAAGERRARRVERDISPLRGRITSVSRLGISGWAADRTRPDRAIEVLVKVNDHPPLRVTTSPPPESAADASRPAAPKPRFALPFLPPLPIARDQTIVATFAETGRLLERGEASIPALHAAEFKARLFPVKRPPLKALFLVSTARAGSSMLMKWLAAHPQILAAKHIIHEIRMAYYYAEALRVLTSPGNHVHSTRPANFGKGEYVIGSNPFYHPLFEQAFATADARDFFFQSVMPQKMRSAFRQVILEYYNCIRADTGKQEAIFFAEKVNSLGLPRRIALAMFPDAIEVVLVRDLRDVLCSQRKYFKGRGEIPITNLERTARRLVKIAQKDGAVVVRYEDLILKEQETLKRLFAALGLDYMPVADADDDSRLFSRHGTSKSPAASIGRWKTDLTDAEKEHASTSCKEFLEAFGYTD